MNLKRIIIISILSLFFLFSFSSPTIFAQSDFDSESTASAFQTQEEVLETKVQKILEERQEKPMGSQEWQLYQKLELLVLKGSLKGETIEAESGNLPTSNLPKYKVGDGLIVAYSQDLEGNRVFYITDYIRRNSLLWLFAIFLIISLLIGRWQGLTSLIGLAISFLVIFKFILPQIYNGADPVQIAILASLVIIPVTFLLSHGLNKKTGVAIAGTLAALILTGILANLFVNLSQLTGFASEEAGFLQAYKPGLINMKGLLLAGIIIGVLGILDDITISQAAIVDQLKKANPKLRLKELYKKAMNVGRDHIASMINTLILVYTGAALPLLLLFINNPSPFSQVINYEIIADEVVRTLVGSIGLILAVPITTLIAAWAVDKNRA